ncbi:hypothetical protein VQ056_00025 [Paenibacillus sp. JTLBN-2024]
MTLLACLALLVILAEWGCTSVGVQFNHPWLLLLLLPLAALMLYAFKSDYRLSGARKIGAATVRSAVILLLVLAISGLQSYTVLEQKKVVYVVDRSASMPEAGPAEDWVQKSAASKRKPTPSASSLRRSKVLTSRSC